MGILLTKLTCGVFLVLVVIFLIGCRSMFAAGAASPPKMPPAVPEASGHLAYIGADGNVYVTDANRTSTVAITHNATAPLLFTICS